MRKQNKENRLKERVLGILYDKYRNNGAVTLGELSSLTGISREKTRKIIHVLATRDKVPVGLSTSWPYGFYIKNEQEKTS